MGKQLLGVVLLVVVAACSSVDQVGMITLPSADPGSLLTKPVAYQTLGVAEGKACRYFAIGLIPWGNSTAGAALEKALASTGGNAMLNASIQTDLYGFIPIYNVFNFTCTTVRGTAIRFEYPSTVE
jgi:hypothetical protein